MVVAPSAFFFFCVLIDVACAVLILAILDGRWQGARFLEFKPLVALGVVSYAFYLWHLPVFFAIRHFDTHWNDVVRVVVAVGATLSLTILSWFLLERPLQKWSKSLESKRRARLSARPVSAQAEADLTPAAAAPPSPPTAPAAVTAVDG